MQRGRLIVFEGGEGAGKTTQIQRSHAWLQSHPVVTRLQEQGLCSDVIVTREPGGTELSQTIRQVLLTPHPEPMHSRTELLLYAADRAQHVDQFLRPKLETGALILCDRYTDSTVAYQGYGRQLDLTLIHQLNHIATQGLVSDLTIWLDLAVDVGLARTQRRGAADRMEQSDITFHQRVRQGFQALAAENPHGIHRVDANRSEDDVQHHIQTLLDHQLRQWYSPFLPH